MDILENREREKDGEGEDEWGEERGGEGNKWLILCAGCATVHVWGLINPKSSTHYYYGKSLTLYLPEKVLQMPRGSQVTRAMDEDSIHRTPSIHLKHTHTHTATIRHYDKPQLKILDLLKISKAKIKSYKISSFQGACAPYCQNCPWEWSILLNGLLILCWNLYHTIVESSTTN